MAHRYDRSLFCTILTILAFLIPVSSSTLHAQSFQFKWHTALMTEQSYDTSYVAPTPASPANTGTIVHIDAAHNNFHTADKRYKPFADLLRNDGYQVASFTEAFTTESLADVDILVIANPVDDANTPEANWVSPIYSAFTDDEIDALVGWVQAGGSLMLIADHFPFPGGADKLGQRFGFTQDNGYNFDPIYFDTLATLFLALPTVQQVFAGQADPGQPAVINQIVAEATPMFIDLGASINSLAYWASPNPSTETGYAYGDGRLSQNSVTLGRPDQNWGEFVSKIVTFTGQSFTYTPVEGQVFHPLLEMGDSTYTVLTEAQDAYFGPTSGASDQALLGSLLSKQQIPPFYYPVVSSTGKLQGALLESGQGRVAMFGEAGMFTAQIAADGKTLMGMNNPEASQNWLYALNVMHFLDGLLHETSSSTEGSIETPLTFELAQNMPNPFNPTTQIRFTLPEAAPVRLEVFDMAGRSVAVLADGMRAAGSHQMTFDATGLASGVYLYRLTAAGMSQTRSMVLLK